MPLTLVEACPRPEHHLADKDPPAVKVKVNSDALEFLRTDMAQSACYHQEAVRTLPWQPSHRQTGWRLAQRQSPRSLLTKSTGFAGKECGPQMLEHIPCVEIGLPVTGMSIRRIRPQVTNTNGAKFGAQSGQEVRVWQTGIASQTWISPNSFPVRPQALVPLRGIKRLNSRTGMKGQLSENRAPRII